MRVKPTDPATITDQTLLKVLKSKPPKPKISYFVEVAKAHWEKFRNVETP